MQARFRNTATELAAEDSLACRSGSRDARLSGIHYPDGAMRHAAGWIPGCGHPSRLLPT